MPCDYFPKGNSLLHLDDINDRECDQDPLPCKNDGVYDNTIG